MNSELLIARFGNAFESQTGLLSSALIIGIHNAILIHPIVKHVDEGGVIVDGFPHHRLPQPLSIELNRLTVRT